MTWAKARNNSGNIVWLDMAPARSSARPFDVLPASSGQMTTRSRLLAFRRFRKFRRFAAPRSHRPTSRFPGLPIGAAAPGGPGALHTANARSRAFRFAIGRLSEVVEI
jgi:hypothetical protein